MSDYDDMGDHFDQEHIPPEHTAQSQIRDYLDSRFDDDTVPKRAKDAIADYVSDKRSGEQPDEFDPDADHSYHPDHGYRDDKGRFL